MSGMRRRPLSRYGGMPHSRKKKEREQAGNRTEEIKIGNERVVSRNAVTVFLQNLKERIKGK